MDSANPVNGYGLVSSYSFEQHNATHTFDTNNLVAGIIEEGGRFDGVDDYIATSGLSSSMNEGAISIWFNSNSLHDGHAKIFSTNANNHTYLQYNGVDSENLTIKVNEFFSGINDEAMYNAWNHFIVTFNSSRFIAYLNGVEKVSMSGSYDVNLSDLKIGIRFDAADNWFNGSIDNIGIWDRSLSTNEIELLYNAGVGTYYDIINPDIIFVSPIDAYNSTSNTIIFKCNATDNQEINNLTLFINGTANTTIYNGTLIQSLELINGYYNWSCETYDIAGNFNETSVRTLNVSSVLNITLNSPIDNYNSSSSNVDFNCSASDDTGIINVSLYIDGIINQTNSSGINNTNYLFSTSLGDEDYNWSCDGYDTTNQRILASERYFTVDTTFPTINITAPSESNDYSILNETINLNWTIAEEHIDACWYNYNGTNNHCKLWR